MAFKAIPLFSLTFLIIVLLSLLSNYYSVLAHSNAEIQSSPFGFIEQLKGYQKGDKVKGIHELKKYMEMFGYLNYTNSKNQKHATADDFDELLESAVKTYQLNFHLNSTGVLDAKTVGMMTKPRCGVADIVNGTTRMRSGKKTSQNNHGSSHFHTVAHYSFLPGSPKWPASKYNLTYAFLPGTRADAIDPVARAFQSWAENSHFRFSPVPDYNNADIKISFERLHHGDGSPFDGPGGIAAHAFPPTNGRFHYDADEAWVADPSQGVYDLQAFALHEIGHLLGLDHSLVPAAIMFPLVAPGKGLDRDDIEGIRALYGF